MGLSNLTTYLAGLRYVTSNISGVRSPAKAITLSHDPSSRGAANRTDSLRSALGRQL